MEPTKPRTRAPRAASSAAKAPRTRATARAAKAPRTVTAPYDTADYLKTEEDMVGLLEAALEDGHPQVIAAALGAIARAHGMTKIAKETGLNREGLYKTLSGEGNPELETFIKVIQALGLQLHATPKAG
jgi:probable addiction module antidote protein